ncbi:hypothetical protein DL95DRAFT_404471 [Leptodontidium sp. 2 PMI_412]|nr:hypothetical protein DL95DRAFT_404471 [Leptodontidium sp. 2 PMI_412]
MSAVGYLGLALCLHLSMIRPSLFPPVAAMVESARILKSTKLSISPIKPYLCRPRDKVVGLQRLANVPVSIRRSRLPALCTKEEGRLAQGPSLLQLGRCAEIPSFPKADIKPSMVANSERLYSVLTVWQSAIVKEGTASGSKGWIIVAHPFVARAMRKVENTSTSSSPASTLHLLTVSAVRTPLPYAAVVASGWLIFVFGWMHLTPLEPGQVKVKLDVKIRMASSAMARRNGIHLRESKQATNQESSRLLPLLYCTQQSEPSLQPSAFGNVPHGVQGRERGII